MNYEKKYKEALERVRELLSRCMDNRDRRSKVYRVEDIESIFPELKESEDEKIRKHLISLVKNWDKDGIYSKYTSNPNDIKQILAWLEKQGEQKSSIKMKTPEESLSIDSDTYNKIVDECIYGEQKPDDKVEPKFKVGDWVVREYTKDIITINQVVDFKRIDDEHFGYTLDDETYFSGSWESSYRLWTIQDAKPGDVLVGIYGTFIFMGESNGGYCGVLSDNTFIRSTGNNEMTKGLHPATKEQCNALLRAMADAGWEFDFEKKELKKKEQDTCNTQLTKFEDAIKDLMDVYRDAIGDDDATVEEVKKHSAYLQSLISQNPAWSEEDERIRKGIIRNLKYLADKAQGFVKDELEERIVWLESLKYRN